MKEDNRPKMENFKIDDSLGHIVNRTAIIIRKRLTALFKDAGFDITPEEFAIISRLWEEDGLFQSEINEKTLKDKTRVTRLLKGLNEKALIEKRVFEEDRRNYRIFLTEKGMGLRVQLIPIVAELMDLSVQNININDLDITKKTLRTIFMSLNSTFIDKE